MKIWSIFVPLVKAQLERTLSIAKYANGVFKILIITADGSTIVSARKIIGKIEFHGN